MSSALLKIWPLLVAAAGIIAAVARTEVALSYADERIQKLEERQVQASNDLRTSVQDLQLNIARICVKVEAGCRE